MAAEGKNQNSVLLTAFPTDVKFRPLLIWDGGGGGKERAGPHLHLLRVGWHRPVRPRPLHSLGRFLSIPVQDELSLTNYVVKADCRARP
jgi:hypothetical protein